MIDLSKFVKKKKKIGTTTNTLAVGDNLKLEGYIDSEPNGVIETKHNYYRKGQQVYGCAGNLVRPVQISKVLGLLCLHPEGKYFTRAYYPHVFKKAVRVE